MQQNKKQRSSLWNVGGELLKNLVEQSSTYGELHNALRQHGAFCNRRTLVSRLKHENIEFVKLQKPVYKGGNGHQRPDDEIFIENSRVCRSVVRKRILKRGLLEYKCAMCKQDDQWHGETLSLVLDHINGKNNDHRLENLRWLCPNCNSQTDTFCSRNRFGQRESSTTEKCVCGNRKNRRSITCFYCALGLRRGKPVFTGPVKRKVEWPPKEELERMIWSMPMTKLAKRFGVSDNAIRKWAKKYGITLPKQGYWIRKRPYGLVPFLASRCKSG